MEPVTSIPNLVDNSVEISVVIPTYNGQPHLEKLIFTLIPQMESLDKSWEIYFVDDHSSDDTFQLIKKFHNRDKRIRGCRLARNEGQQKALFWGLLSCRGRLVITMDDDGQHPLSRIPQLLSTMDEGWDVVYMVNRDRKRSLLFRCGTALTDLFFTLFCSKPARIKIGSYRILRRSLIQDLGTYSVPFLYVSALIFKKRPKVKVTSLTYMANEVAIPSHPSRISLKKRIVLFAKLFYYYGPLRSLAPQKIYTPPPEYEL